jgi:hypothetical protein
VEKKQKFDLNLGFVEKTFAGFYAQWFCDNVDKNYFSTVAIMI